MNVLPIAAVLPQLLAYLTRTNLCNRRRAAWCRQNNTGSLGAIGSLVAARPKDSHAGAKKTSCPRSSALHVKAAR